MLPTLLRHQNSHSDAIFCLCVCITSLLRIVFFCQKLVECHYLVVLLTMSQKSKPEQLSKLIIVGLSYKFIEQSLKPDFKKWGEFVDYVIVMHGTRTTESILFAYKPAHLVDNAQILTKI